jgi:hypothetical protein
MSAREHCEKKIMEVRTTLAALFKFHYQLAAQIEETARS